MSPMRTRAGPDSLAASFDRCFDVLGFRFTVRTEVPRSGVLIRRYLAPFEADGPSPRHAYALVCGPQNGFVLSRNGRVIDEAASLAEVLDLFLWEVNQQAIRRSKRFLLVHAAAASWRGAGIVIPAMAGAGKSTLVAGLTRDGFAYLSDEAAAIDPRTAELHPYPKAVSLEPGSMEALPDLRGKLPPEYRWPTRFHYHFRPTDLRPRAVGRACRIAWVIAATYEPGASTLLEPVSRGAALFELARNALNLSRFKARGLAVLERVVQGAECYRLRMGDLGSAVQAVGGVVR